MKRYLFLSFLTLAMLAMVIGCGQGPGLFGFGVVGGTGGPDSDGYGSINITADEGEGGGGDGGGGAGEYGDMVGATTTDLVNTYGPPLNTYTVTNFTIPGLGTYPELTVYEYFFGVEGNGVWVYFYIEDDIVIYVEVEWET